MDNACGGDQNPQPRRTLELAEQHGRALANGVEAALLSPQRPVDGPLAASVEEVHLARASGCAGDRIVFDYDYCKGCGVCVNECSRAVIYMKAS